jgi:hypothetical protein
MAGQDAKKSGGLMELLIPLVAVTALGGGGGWFLGTSALAPKETVGSASGRDGTGDREKNDGKAAVNVWPAPSASGNSIRPEQYA